MRLLIIAKASSKAFSRLASLARSSSFIIFFRLDSLSISSSCFSLIRSSRRAFLVSAFSRFGKSAPIFLAERGLILFPGKGSLFSLLASHCFLLSAAATVYAAVSSLISFWSAVYSSRFRISNPV